jgi:hypothetical protein
MKPKERFEKAMTWWNSSCHNQKQLYAKTFYANIPHQHLSKTQINDIYEIMIKIL